MANTVEISLDDVDAGKAQRFIIAERDKGPVAEIRYCYGAMTEGQKKHAQKIAQDCINSLVVLSAVD